MDSGSRPAPVTLRPGSWECSASLRYFAGDREFTSGLAELLDGPLPEAQQAVCRGASASAQHVLAWRSPTETVLLCSAASLAAVDAFARERKDLCVVDQTGGIRAWVLSGPQVADVLVRLGAASIVPAAGTVRIGRVAELTVMVCDVGSQATLLLVERVYEAHLLAWVRETIADL